MTQHAWDTPLGAATEPFTAPSTAGPPVAAQPVDEHVVVDVPLVYPTDSTYVRVPVTLGARDSLWFLVDLGAPQTVIWPQTWALPGTGGERLISGMGGGTTVQAESIRVGGLVRWNVPVRVLDIPALLPWKPDRFRPPDVPAPTGILGLDLLEDETGRRYDIEFNFPARRFRLYTTTTRPGDTASAGAPGPAGASGQVGRPGLPTWTGVRGLVCTRDLNSPVFRSGGGPAEGPSATGRAFVVVSVTVAGRPVRALLDTGAPRSNLPADIAALLGLTLQTPGVTVQDTLGGVNRTYTTPRYRASGVAFALDGIPLRPSVVYFREGQATPAGTAMILGLNTVSDRVLFIAASTGEVCLGPRRSSPAARGRGRSPAPHA